MKMEVFHVIMKKTAINRPGSSPVAPYSPGVEAGGFIFVSGQPGFDPIRRVFYGDTIEAQTRGAMDNLAEVLELAGSSIEKAVMVNIYLKDVNQFDAVNEIYGSYFHGVRPARTTIQAELPKGALIVVDAIAIK